MRCGVGGEGASGGGTGYTLPGPILALTAHADRKNRELTYQLLWSLSTWTLKWSWELVAKAREAKTGSEEVWRVTAGRFKRVQVKITIYEINIIRERVADCGLRGEICVHMAEKWDGRKGSGGARRYIVILIEILRDIHRHTSLLKTPAATHRVA